MKLCRKDMQERHFFLVRLLDCQLQQEIIAVLPLRPSFQVTRTVLIAVNGRVALLYTCWEHSVQVKFGAAFIRNEGWCSKGNLYVYMIYLLFFAVL